MIEDEFAPLREAEAKATKGPWFRLRASGDIIVADDELVARGTWPGTGDFIVMARNLVPALLRKHDDMVAFLKSLPCSVCEAYDSQGFIGDWCRVRPCEGCGFTFDGSDPRPSAYDAFLRGRGKK